GSSKQKEGGDKGRRGNQGGGGGGAQAGRLSRDVRGPKGTAKTGRGFERHAQVREGGDDRGEVSGRGHRRGGTRRGPGNEHEDGQAGPLTRACPRDRVTEANTRCPEQSGHRLF